MILEISITIIIIIRIKNDYHREIILISLNIGNMGLSIMGALLK